MLINGRHQWFASKDDSEPDLFKQENFMSTMNTFYTTDWPESITIDSTWLCDLQQSSGNGVRFLTYFDGDKAKFDPTIDLYIKHPELVKQLKRRSLPEKSTRFLHETLVAQWSEETEKVFPANKSYSIYSSFVFRNDRPTIERVTALIRDKAIAFRKAFSSERVEFLATFIHAGSKMSTPKSVSSAFFWREAMYHMYLTLRPLSLQGEAAFINFPDGVLPADVCERAYWGDNRDELRRVKQIWHKNGFFQSEQGVSLPGSFEGGQEKPGDQGNDEQVTDSLASKQWEFYDSNQWEVYKTKDIMGDLKKFADLGL
ncbi:hypothetical protein B0H12DRAFT_1274617 [Mycena haematopus]|nr:hypothetical protein B0H12DRAFT_1274617 [Mycena haematopus]